MDPQFLELIHAEIDGRLSREERERLWEVMARDAKLRAEYEQLKALSDTLSAAPAIRPPLGFRESVMREVRSSPAERSYAAAPRRSMRIAMPYAYAFAAGLLVGVFGLLWYAGGATGFGMESWKLSGSMSSVPAPPAAAPLDRIDIDAAGVLGSASLVRQGTEFALMLDLRAGQPVAAALRFDGQKVLVRGLSSDSEGLRDVQLDEGGLFWRMSGNRSIAVELALSAVDEAEITLEFDGPGGLTRAGKILLAAGE